MMIPDSKNRLEAAVFELSSYLVRTAIYFTVSFLTAVYLSQENNTSVNSVLLEEARKIVDSIE